LSYIRCLSNPEGLYAYGSGDNQVWIHIDETYSSKGHQGTMSIPQDLLTAAIRAFDEEYDQPIEVGGIRIHEAHVYEDKLEEEVGENWSGLEQLRRRADGEEVRSTRFGIKLEYDGKWMLLWRVTWEYFARGFTRD
jgi:hypothetical protein